MTTDVRAQLLRAAKGFGIGLLAAIALPLGTAMIAFTPGTLEHPWPWVTAAVAGCIVAGGTYLQERAAAAKATVAQQLAADSWANRGTVSTPGIPYPVRLVDPDSGHFRTLSPGEVVHLTGSTTAMPPPSATIRINELPPITPTTGGQDIEPPDLTA